jgi:hypothetical protein
VRRWRWIALAIVALAFAVAGLALFSPDRTAQIVAQLRPPQDHAAFERWLALDERNAREFSAFEAYLSKQGVRYVVPSWQLVRSDGSVGARCTGEPFAVPPRALWPNVVPVLRFVAREIVPHTGPLEANSAWRSEKANKCARGASRSRHLTFAGVDFVTQRKVENRQLFKLLCGLQAKLGPPSRFGLGAYFDPAAPGKNSKGQFHIDLAGYRTWGFGYGGGTSACIKLGSTEPIARSPAPSSPAAAPSPASV